jgi:hypothetical protein
MTFPDHGALTDAFLTSLQTGLGSSSTDPLVGDALAPAAGGWLEGQPGDGVFRPYVVLASGGAAVRGPGLASYDPLIWTVSFSLRSFGGSRSQTDRMAHRARGVTSQIAGATFGSPAWSVISVEWQGLGPVVRVDAVNPPYWQIFDTVSLVVSS